MAFNFRQPQRNMFQFGNVSTPGVSIVAGGGDTSQNFISQDPQLSTRQALAQALIAPALSGNPIYSPVQALAQLATAGLGGYMAGQVGQEAQTKQDEVMKGLAEALRAGQGTPGGLDEKTGINWNPTKPDPMRTLQALQNSNNPMLRQQAVTLGMSDLAAKQKLAQDLELDTGKTDNEIRKAMFQVGMVPDPSRPGKFMPDPALAQGVAGFKGIVAGAEAGSQAAARDPIERGQKLYSKQLDYTFDPAIAGRKTAAELDAENTPVMTPNGPIGRVQMNAAQRAAGAAPYNMQPTVQGGGAISPIGMGAPAIGPMPGPMAAQPTVPGGQGQPAAAQANPMNPRPGVYQAPGGIGQNDLGKAQAEKWMTEHDTSAAKLVPLYQIKTSMQNGLQTGPTAEWRNGAAQWLTDFGGDPKSVNAFLNADPTNAKLFQSSASELAKQAVKGLGYNPTDRDLTFAQNLGVKFTDPVQATNALVDYLIARESAPIKKAQELIPRYLQGENPLQLELDWQKNNPGLALAREASERRAENVPVGTVTTTRDGRKIMWDGSKWGPATGVGQLPAGVPQQAPSGAQAAPLTSKADYDRLPKGSSYTAPDGSVRIKQ